MSEAAYWIALSMVPDVGPVMARKLLAAFGSPEKVFSASFADLVSVEGISKERAVGIRDFDLWAAAEACVAAAERKEIRVITYEDPSYPQVLKETDGSPIVLFMLGEYIAADRYAVAVVGSRDHTSYGEQVALRITGDLAEAGLTIVSGMARGIDALAHKAALNAGGRTVAVLGSGADVCYPWENKALMDGIIRSGCVISEFPPGTMPHKDNFPRRNRLISGLSLGVLVVEAALDSGSLITARYALEQNRDVFAVPGPVTSRTSAGTNAVIRQGGRLVSDARHIIEDLAPVLKGFIRAGNTAPSVEMTEEENSLCAVLSRDPKHIDLLSRETTLPVHRILGLLLGLEMKGVVRQGSGKRFYLA